MSEHTDREVSEAEQAALSGHLELIRAEQMQPSVQLAERVVRRVRWQKALRQPLQFVGRVGSAVAAGLAALIGEAKSKKRVQR